MFKWNNYTWKKGIRYNAQISGFALVKKALSPSKITFFCEEKCFSLFVQRGSSKCCAEISLK